MALIVLAADKGSPGVTTTAVAISAVWPRRALLAEVDPAGGDLVYRGVAAHGGPLDPNTGMLSAAATARRGLAAEQLWDHAQPMSGGLEVLVGLGTSEQSAGLGGLWPTFGRAFAGLADSAQGAADVIADCGRIGVDSASVEMFPHASLVLLISRSEPEHLARIRDRAGTLSTRLHGPQRGAAQLGTPPIGVLLIAESSTGTRLSSQVNDMLMATQSGARVVGVVAYDPAGADQLSGRKRGRLDKSLLIRSTRKVVSDLHQQFGTSWSQPGGGNGSMGGPHGIRAGNPGPGGAGPGGAGPGGTGPGGPMGGGYPGQPGPPGQPGHPGQHGQPGHPGQPGQPGHPGQPAQQPGYGGQPAQPQHPGQPGRPGYPGAGAPAGPGGPGTTPGGAPAPGAPGGPAGPGAPRHGGYGSPPGAQAPGVPGPRTPGGPGAPGVPGQGYGAPGPGMAAASPAAPGGGYGSPAGPGVAPAGPGAARPGAPAGGYGTPREGFGAPPQTGQGQGSAQDGYAPRDGHGQDGRARRDGSAGPAPRDGAPRDSAPREGFGAPPSYGPGAPR